MPRTIQPGTCLILAAIVCACGGHEKPGSASPIGHDSGDSPAAPAADSGSPVAGDGTPEASKGAAGTAAAASGKGGSKAPLAGSPAPLTGATDFSSADPNAGNSSGGAQRAGAAGAAASGDAAAAPATTAPNAGMEASTRMVERGDIYSVLGDKRTSLALSNTVGLMFCADAVEIHAPAAMDFETIMRGILAEYDTARALRIPTLHFWAPHCVRPGIEAADYPNKIPAVFNYYTVGTVRERAEKKAEINATPDTTAGLPWPPELVTLPPQNWPRRSSPLFLHVMDMGHEAAVSLHFFQGAVSPADQQRFTALLFQVFAETVPA